MCRRAWPLAAGAGGQAGTDGWGQAGAAAAVAGGRAKGRTAPSRPAAAALARRRRNEPLAGLPAPSFPDFCDASGIVDPPDGLPKQVGDCSRQRRKEGGMEQGSAGCSKGA